MYLHLMYIHVNLKESFKSEKIFKKISKKSMPRAKLKRPGLHT